MECLTKGDAGQVITSYPQYIIFDKYNQYSVLGLSSRMNTDYSRAPKTCFRHYHYRFVANRSEVDAEITQVNTTVLKREISRKSTLMCTPKPPPALQRSQRHP